APAGGDGAFRPICAQPRGEPAGHGARPASRRRPHRPPAPRAGADNGAQRAGVDRPGARGMPPPEPQHPGRAAALSDLNGLVSDGKKYDIGRSDGAHRFRRRGRRLAKSRVREEAMMRKILIPLAGLGTVALVALPVAAQHRNQTREEQTLRGAAAAARQAAPMVDRSTDRALDMDIGPLLDALHPYSARGRHLTLREMGRRDDPDFEAKLHRSIYRGTARAAATLDAMANAAPSIRQSLRQMEA